VPGIFYHIIDILGGIALFLYGVSESTDAFRSGFSTRTREWMSRFAQKKPRALLFGIVLSAVAQGSTVSTSIAISFVDVGMLTLAGSVVVMMGASIGGTFVTFLVSLDIVGFSPLLLAISFAMTRFGKGRVEKAGTVLHAVSLILVGMMILQLGVRPLLNDASVYEAVLGIARRPFVMFAASVLGTAILQSSSSVMALAVTLAASGALPAGAIFPVALGSHLGSTFTMLLAAMGGRRNARLLGIATFIYKLAGVVLFLPFIGWAESLLNSMSFSMPICVVLAQVLIVCLNAVVFYPVSELLTRACTFILEKTRGVELGIPIYLDERIIEIPALAIHLLSKEMIRLANYTEAFLQMLLFPQLADEGLKNLLPQGIQDLTEACERYMYAIQPPSIAEDPETCREYRTISYAMVAMKESSRLITRRFRTVVEKNGVRQLSKEIGSKEWDHVSHLLLASVRDSFHAFALGDADLAQRALDTDDDFDRFMQNLRSRMLLKNETLARKKESVLIDFATLASRLMHSALEVARGEAAHGLFGEENGLENPSGREV
jgi:phosphate:Na+ symporter